MNFLKNVFGKNITQENVELIIDILELRLSSESHDNNYIAGILEGQTHEHFKKHKLYGKYRLEIIESDILKVIHKLLGTGENEYQDGLIKKEYKKDVGLVYDFNKIKIWKKYFEGLKSKYPNKIIVEYKTDDFIKNIYKIYDSYFDNDKDLYKKVYDATDMAEKYVKYMKGWKYGE